MDQLRASSIDAAATTGDDLIRGFGTNDTLDGGAGNDTLAGGGGSDTYLFDLGDGTDTIVETADGAINKLAFGSGIAIGDIRLVRTAAAPDDLVLLLSNGTDKVTIKSQFANGSAAGLQLIQFADGTVWLAKDFETILLAQPATAGADYLAGNDNTNTIDGLAGDDIILGGGGDDTLHGSDGNDTLYGGAGDDKLYGGAGDDILSGDTGADLLDGGDGFDIADYSFSLDNWSIDLAAGTARIVTSQNSTVVESLTGIEGVIGGLGSDTITGNDGANQLEGGGGNDTLNGAGGDDVFVFDGNENGVDAVDGSAGYDRIEAASDDTVIGLASLANVELVTAQGHANVTIETTDDADTLDLSGTQLDGIASINMGGGNDVITSSLGADVINAGDGDDIIRYVGASTGGDQVDGGAGYDTIAAGADDTIIRLASFQNVEAITGNGFSNVVLARTDASEVTDLNGIALSGLAYIDLAGGDDTFVGTAQADTVRGGAGDDHLVGADGDDVFQYAGTGSGLDTIDGGAGYDKLQAAANGAMIGIRSTANIEAIDGNSFTGVTITTGDGDDHLDLNGITLTGIAGIVGGKGNDVIRGSGGDDTFLVSGTDQGLDDFDGAAEQDRILAGADGTVISVSRIASIEMIDGGGHANVHLATTDGNDSLALQGVTLTGISEIDLGTGDDSFAGSSGSDTISGGLGNDTLSGGAGDDVYLFNHGDGNDVIRENNADGVGGGNDTLRFGAGVSVADVQVTRVNSGTDYLLTIANGGGTVLIAGDAASDAANWIENIVFTDGTIWTRESLDQSVVLFTDGDDNIQGTNDAETLHGGAGNDSISGYGGDDTIYGDAGHDTIDGGDGNDRIVGGTGNDTLAESGGDDTYVWNLGDGDDYITGGFGGDGFNTIEFGPGIAAADLRYAYSNVTGPGYGLKISVEGQPGSVSIDYQMVSPLNERIDQLRFADGTILSREQFQGAALAQLATSGDDVIYGSLVSETISAGGGNDYIDARDGNDRIIGGVGSDLINESSGDDTYVWNLGDGNDVVRFSGWWDGWNTVEFGAGIAPADLRFAYANNTNGMLITVAGQTGSLLLEDEIADYGDSGIDQVRFADGTLWTRKQLLEAFYAQTTSSENDTVRIANIDDLTISSGAGNDVINGGAGRDTIIGGADNDLINESGGDDTYVWNRGDGQDTIQGFGWWDAYNTLAFGTGISQSDVFMWFEGSHVHIGIEGDSGSVVLADQRYSGDGIDRILFADGSSWDRPTYLSQAIAATSQDDVIKGTSSANPLRGLGGNDRLNGAGGSDVLKGDDGDDLLLGDGYAATGPNRIVNGSFELLGPSPNYQGWGVSSDDIPGWTKTNSGHFNQVNSGVDGAPATDGQYLMDLDDSGGAGSNMDIRQTIADLDEGEKLILSFDHGNPRNSDSGYFAVYWNDELVATITALGAQMRSTELDLTAIEGDNVLRFQGLGAEDAVGGQIDNVRLYAAEAATGGDDMLTGGQGDDILDGGAGNDTAVFAGVIGDYTIATTDGVLTVADDEPGMDGNDGTDTLIGIETALFKNGSINLAAPIVLDLDENGVSLIDRQNSRAAFDWNGDGFADRTGWVGKGDGLLYFDRNGDGAIGNANELSFIGDKPGAKSDLDGLSAFDTNGDDLFDRNDDKWEQFGVWKDENGDGLANPEELFALADAGIGSISLVGQATSQSWASNDNIVLNDGDFTWSDGRTGKLGDVAFNYLDAKSETAREAQTFASQLVEAMGQFGNNPAYELNLEGVKDAQVVDFLPSHNRYASSGNFN